MTSKMTADSSASRQPRGQLAIKNFAMPSDTNANGDIFGGWLLAQMDLGAGVAAKQYSKGRVVTVAIDGMTFKQPVHVGDLISCYTDIIRVGNTSMTIHVEVWAEPESHESAHIVTEGTFTFVAIDDLGHPRTLPTIT